MPAIECLGSEWTQKPASPDEAELDQGLLRVVIVDERPDDANRSGLTTIKRLNLELRLETVHTKWHLLHMNFACIREI